jgi:hypothetical protein
LISASYKLPAQGLGTDFSQYERPLSFAEIYTNRYRNITGGAERRPGMLRATADVIGAPNLTRLHEWVSNQGAEVLLASDDFGSIYNYSTSSSAWTQCLTGKAQTRQLSAQAEDKLIFVNGTDRNFYTEDGGTTWKELKALITRGTLAGGSNSTTVIDGDISNWISTTLVANNDIVFNATLSAYGIISTVVTANLTTTVIGSAAVATGWGVGSRNQASGDSYEIIDYVDLNIIPQQNGALDNVALATTGTTTSVIAVSGVNFANTNIRTGDFIYNTTRAAVSIVGSVSANINLTRSITAQVAGDTITFFKSAMPIASWIHVHYGRVYYLDSRDQRTIVISAPDDPQDVTTYQKTLEATSYSFGTQQPTGDVILTMGTFQQYFVAAGLKNVYIYSGNTPIADASSTDVNFEPVAVYPDGLASKFSLTFNGSDLLYIADDGLQAISIGNISNTTIHNNVSTPIRNEINEFIKQTSQNNIQATFYPKKSWVINKVGDRCYVLNNEPTYTESGELTVTPAWHLFTGKWAQQNHYFVRRNGDLISCGSQGRVYYMDSSASTDDGTVISTDLTTAWYRLEEPQKTRRVKQGQYIRPIFESGVGLVYTINAVAGWDNLSSDTVSVTIAASGAIGQAVVGVDPIGAGPFAQANKYPLRWRGEEVRLQFTTQSSASPDIITGFTLDGEIGGLR